MAVMSLQDFNRRITDDRYTVHSPVYENAQRATMYVFTPRQVPDVNVRSYQYDFSDGFIEDLYNTVDRSSNIGANNGYQGLLATYMSDSRYANKAIAPSAYGQRFSGSLYSDLYTFLLVIDNATFEGRYNPSALSNRLLYTGFFLDQPVIEGVGGQLIFNERCPMLITHLTHLNIKNIYGSTGAIVQAQPMDDIDIVHPLNMMQMDNGVRSHLLRPSDIVASTTYDSDGREYQMLGNGYLGNMSNAVKLSTTLNNPKEQLSNIVTGMTKTAMDLKVPPAMSSNEFRPYAIADDFSNAELFKKNMMETNVLPERYIGLQVNSQIFIGDLLAKYPILRTSTQVFQFPFALNDTPMDNSAPNPINIWSSLLMNSVPSALASFGICDATFRYDSINMNSISMFDNNPVWEVYLLESFVPEETGNALQNRWNQAIRYLETRIFPIILENSGNFSVMIKYSSAKECAVQLNLIDMTDTVNNGVVMTNALYGGFQSPLVGTEQLKEANCREVNNAASIINTQLAQVSSVIM